MSLIKLITSLFNTKKEEEDEFIPITLQHILAPNGIGVTPQLIMIDNTLWRTFYLKAFPKKVPVGWLGILTALNENLLISIDALPMEISKAKAMFNKIQNSLISSETVQGKYGALKDYGVERSIAEIDKLRQELDMLPDEKPWKIRILVSIGAGHGELNVQEQALELQKASETLVSQLKGASMEPEGAYLREMQYWLMNSPIINRIPELEIPDIFFDTSAFAYSLPFGSSDISEENGIEYGLNQITGGIVKINRWHEKRNNAHMVIIGQTGSGKSSFAKVTLMRELANGTDVFVIDPMGEYKNIANYLGGEIIKFSFDSPSVYNPFEFEYIPSSKEDDNFFSKILFISRLINLLVREKIPEEKLPYIQDAVISAYRKRGIIQGKFSTYRKEPPTLKDVYQELIVKFGDPRIQSPWEKSEMQRIAALLQPWVDENKYGKFFSGKGEKIDLTNRLIVFDISDMERSLQPIGLMLMLHFVDEITKRDPKKRILIVDEAWRLMQGTYEQATNRGESTVTFFLSEIMKKARKRKLGLTLITTDAEDFLISDTAKALVNSASLVALFKHRESAVETLQSFFKLNSQEIETIISMPKGEYLLLLPDFRVDIFNIMTEREMYLTETNKIKEVEV